MRSALASALVIGTALCSFGQRPQEATKPIPVNVKVDTEGPNGIWAQSGTDLSPKEISDLKSAIEASVSKQPNIQLVGEDDPRDIVGIAVVAAKVKRDNGLFWFVLSGVVTFSKAKPPQDLLMTHDVIIGPDVSHVANTVAFQFASVRFRASFGLKE